MGVNFNLVRYVKECREMGLNDLQIRDALVKAGWQREDIEESLRYGSKKIGWFSIWGSWLGIGVVVLVLVGVIGWLGRDYLVGEQTIVEEEIDVRQVNVQSLVDGLINLSEVSLSNTQLGSSQGCTVEAMYEGRMVRDSYYGLQTNRLRDDQDSMLCGPSVENVFKETYKIGDTVYNRENEKEDFVVVADGDYVELAPEPKVVQLVVFPVGLTFAEPMVAVEGDMNKVDAMGIAEGFKGTYSFYLNESQQVESVHYDLRYDSGIELSGRLSYVWEDVVVSPPQVQTLLELKSEYEAVIGASNLHGKIVYGDREVVVGGGSRGLLNELDSLWESAPTRHCRTDEPVLRNAGDVGTQVSVQLLLDDGEEDKQELNYAVVISLNKPDKQIVRYSAVVRREELSCYEGMIPESEYEKWMNQLETLN